ncbi:MAG: twin-arginine translocase TatA/TatE family subunit [Sphingobacteriales bacterium]
MFSQVFLFFEFTAPEIMLILFVVLLLFGGEKLPGLAKGLGKGIREFKDASEGVKREITSQIDTFQAKKEAEAAAVTTTAATQNPVTNPVSDVPVAPTEAPAVVEQHDAVPVAEIGSITAVEPVKNTAPVADPFKVNETHVEHVTPEPVNTTTHEEHKA